MASLNNLKEIEKLFEEALACRDGELVSSIVDFLIDIDATVSMSEDDRPKAHIPSKPKPETISLSVKFIGDPQAIYDFVLEKTSDEGLAIEAAERCSSISEAIEMIENQGK